MCVCASVAARRAAKGGNNFGRNKISSGRCCKAQQEKDVKKKHESWQNIIKTPRCRTCRPVAAAVAAEGGGGRCWD